MKVSLLMKPRGRLPFLMAKLPGVNSLTDLHSSRCSSVKQELIYEKMSILFRGDSRRSAQMPLMRRVFKRGRKAKVKMVYQVLDDLYRFSRYRPAGSASGLGKSGIQHQQKDFDHSPYSSCDLCLVQIDGSQPSAAATTMPDILTVGGCACLGYVQTKNTIFFFVFVVLFLHRLRHSQAAIAWIFTAVSVA